MASMKYYYDLMSQPCRAVYMLLRINNVPVELKPVAIRKGEHMSEEYKQVNPFAKCPALEHDGLIINESIPMSKYIIQKFELADHWYPKDLKKRAKVDEYLHWQHFNTRLIAATLFRNMLIIPAAKGKKTDPAIIEKNKKAVTEMVSQLESYFLKDTTYLNSEHLSLADLFGACELMQLNACHDDDLYLQNSRVSDWMARVKEETNPHFDEAHKVTYMARKQFPILMKTLE